LSFEYFAFKAGDSDPNCCCTSNSADRRGHARLANEMPAGYLVVMKLPVVMRPGEDSWIVVECPIIPGCISQGKTHDEALANIREAIELCLENRERE
jgi:predicted RNase H-like HicB family nuclease